MKKEMLKLCPIMNSVTISNCTLHMYGNQLSTKTQYCAKGKCQLWTGKDCGFKDWSIAASVFPIVHINSLSDNQLLLLTAREKDEERRNQLKRVLKKRLDKEGE